MSQRRQQNLLPGMEEPPPPDASAPHVPAPPTTPAADRFALCNRGEVSAVPDLSGKSVWLVDAHSLIFQVFHAIAEMTSPRGQPVNAVFGFTRDVLFLLDQKQPDYLFCAFDVSGHTFRHEIYEDYKLGREEMPEDLRPQIDLIHRVLDSLGVPVLGLEGYEADDVIATLAHQVDQAGGECFVVTGDKDCRQMITPRVKIYNVRKHEVFDAENLREEWGVTPAQVVDFQALTGDSVDNVPGVPLIGPKIARELLERFGTLDEVLDNADQVSGKKRKQNLIDFRQQALMSRELVRLDTQVPIHVDWRQGEAQRISKAGAVEVFQELGFRGFTNQARDAAESQQPPEQEQPWQADYQAVTTPEALKELVEHLQQQQRISFDTETTHESPTWAEIVGYSFAAQAGKAWYVPVRAPEGEPCLDPQQTLQALRPVLENVEIEKIGQNLKYDMIVLNNVGVKLAGTKFDTFVASYLLDAGARNHGMDELSRRYLNHATVKIKELIGSGKNQKRMDEVPLEKISWYAAEDADVPLRLEPILRAQLEEKQLARLYGELEEPLIDVLMEMESAGIKIDLDRLAELSSDFAGRMEALEAEIYHLADGEFNIASPKQLQEVLFERLGLPRQKKTKSGSSTDAAVLEVLADQHPLPARILEYRQYAKLKGTYVDALPAMVNPRTGRVHASFNQGVTATGRLSSSDPNLQNIPIRSQAGKAIRSAFLPGQEGWKLLCADYSQIELRVLAHFSGDETLRQAFERDEDIHARVASQVFDVPLDEVTGDMRRKAKAVNFGVVYGQSPFGLARQLGIDKDEAAAFIDDYFERYPGVDEFLAKTLADCRENGYVETLLGRKRSVRGIRRDARRQKNLPERTAVNTVIQGSAADLIKLAMINIHRQVQSQNLPAVMLLQIHDELVFEVPAAHLEATAEFVTRQMSEVLPLAVPLKLDVSAGDNWVDAEPL